MTPESVEQCIHEAASLCSRCRQIQFKRFATPFQVALSQESLKDEQPSKGTERGCSAGCPWRVVAALSGGTSKKQRIKRYLSNQSQPVIHNAINIEKRFLPCNRLAPHQPEASARGTASLRPLAPAFGQHSFCLLIGLRAQPALESNSINRSYTSYLGTRKCS